MKKFRFCVLLVLLVLCLNGCATLNSLLSLPFQIIGHSLDVVKKVVGIAKDVPVPPPSTWGFF